MKTILFYITLFLLLLQTACVKTIASEEEVSYKAFYHNKAFGASAQELLTDKDYTSLRVEIQYMKGFAPSRESIANLRSFLNRHLNKPDGITITTKEIPPVKDKVLSTKEIIELEKQHRLAYTSGKRLAVFILFTNGDHSNNKILGLAYRNTSAVVFGKNIKENSNKIGKPSRTNLESTVLLHEMGHLMGLVNLRDSTHDEAHASHCTNRKCLMYYGIEIEDKFGHLIKKAIPTLDDHCLELLKENGGKETNVATSGATPNAL